MERKTQLPRPQDWLRPTWEALGEEVEEGDGERVAPWGRAWLRSHRPDENE
jgi:hypothetical protein